jgi:hypothetical protein
MFRGPASILVAVTGSGSKSDIGSVSNCSGSTIVDFENVIDDCDFLKSHNDLPHYRFLALHKIVICSKFN